MPSTILGIPNYPYTIWPILFIMPDGYWQVNKEPSTQGGGGVCPLAQESPHIYAS